MNKEQLLCWSMWAVAYAIVSGVSIAGNQPGQRGDGLAGGWTMPTAKHRRH